MARDSDSAAAASANDIFFCAPASVPSLPDNNRRLLSEQISRQNSQSADEKVDNRAKKLDVDELLVRVQHKDGEALSELFDRYHRLVFSIGYRVLHSLAEADDLVQEVFVFLWSRSNLFVPGKHSAHEWIIRVIYHRAFDRRRYLIPRGSLFSPMTSFTD